MIRQIKAATPERSTNAAQIAEIVFAVLLFQSSPRKPKSRSTKMAANRSEALEQNRVLGRHIMRRVFSRCLGGTMACRSFMTQCCRLTTGVRGAGQLDRKSTRLNSSH